jgi:protein-disulfide isomerase
MSENKIESKTKEEKEISPSASSNLQQPTNEAKGIYAIGIAIIIGLAVLLGTLWLANQNFNSALSQYQPLANEKGTTAPQNEQTQAQSNNQAKNAAKSLPAIDLRALPIRGSPNAPVTIYEIADFECPYCQQAYPILDQVMKKYNESVKLVFLHFPLPQHPNAQKAAEAAECANDQGKFWEYYDSLFSTKRLEVSELKKQAASLGLDMKKFNSCLDGGEKAPLIEAFVNLVAQNGIYSTPTFIINGRILQDYSLDGFSKEIDNILNPPRAKINATGRPTRGGSNAAVRIIEFSDFQCPYCQMAYGVVKQIEQEYGEKVSITYMHFPLTTIHPQAQKAAEAAECAYRQNESAFWKFHDWMFENRALDIDSLKAYASTIGLNTTQFNKCLDGGEATARVLEDQKIGGENGISGTPGFFINGLLVSGYSPYEQFRLYIERELALQNKSKAG